jgi:hypothetical protein
MPTPDSTQYSNVTDSRVVPALWITRPGTTGHYRGTRAGTRLSRIFNIAVQPWALFTAPGLHRESCGKVNKAGAD